MGLWSEGFNQEKMHKEITPVTGEMVEPRIVWVKANETSVMGVILKGVHI